MAVQRLSGSPSLIKRLDEARRMLMLLDPPTAFPAPPPSGGLSGYQRQRLRGLFKNRVVGWNVELKLLADMRASCWGFQVTVVEEFADQQPGRLLSPGESAPNLIPSTPFAPQSLIHGHPVFTFPTLRGPMKACVPSASRST